MFDEIAKFACPDCGNPIAASMTLLSDDGKRAVHVSVCARCADHATVRAYVALTPDEWESMLRAGIPVVHYR